MIIRTLLVTFELLKVLADTKTKSADVRRILLGPRSSSFIIIRRLKERHKVCNLDSSYNLLKIGNNLELNIQTCTTQTSTLN